MLFFFLVCITQAYAQPFEYQNEINEFYLEHEGAPFWIDGKKLNKNGETLLQTLKNAWHHGLNPKQYNMPLSPKLEPIQTELLLTQGYIKYARDLSGMRVDPKEVGIDPNYWKKRISSKEALDKLKNTSQPFEIFLENLAPQTQTYKAFKNEMSINPTAQLAVNMERLRWLPDQKPGRYIIVNIPSARLWAIENGQAKFEMPVIIGRTDRPTPTFITDINGVRFNPTWTIPPTIKEKDIWPRLKKDSHYLWDKEVEIYESDNTIDPLSVDWNEISVEQLQNFKMVQLPGKTNPLGRIRVLMPNKYAIFLHDTSQTEHFSDSERSYSSGCVRMKNPEKVAAFILQKDVKPYLSSQETKDVFTDHKIPVYLLYHTIWMDAQGKITYGKDVYKYDKKLQQHIELAKEIPDNPSR